MRVLQEPQALRAALKDLRKRGKTVGLVPTMGFLHEGHLSIVRQAKKENQIVVASIFADVLGVEKISTDEDFLRLGGDSLRATQVISRIRALFQVELPIVTLFNKATVAKLAAEIAASMASLAPRSTEKILAELHDLSEADGQRSHAGTLDRNSSS